LTNQPDPSIHTPESSAGTTDIQSLRAEVARLAAELAAARLESANRLAAMRAALGAATDGEPDPLEYLRDELPEYNPITRSGR
jgi:outer membrane protein TolC